MPGFGSGAFGAGAFGVGEDPVVEYLFTPPTHEEPIRTTESPLRFYRLTHANSIVKVNGHFVSRRGLTSDSLAGLTDGVDFFVGGYLYVIDEATAAALAADGFEVNTPAASSGSVFGSEAFGSGPFGG